jgi:aryl-alcohol dehydrogenase-like predicted oxidoreductase
VEQTTMDRIALPFLDVPVSRLALGTAWFEAARYDDIAALLDTFVELGGNLIDTAENYGDAERIIGRWMQESPRGADVIISTKGGHPYGGRNRITRDDVERDLEGSLERLRRDSIELYLLHRDDTTVPVGAVVDLLNVHLDAGRFRTYGLSNWTTDRLDQADAYARSHGLRTFTVSSTNLSLARWSSPPWDGVVSASDRATRAWHERRGVPLIAWSPQAAGWFAARDPSRFDDEGRRVVGVYDTPGNRRRRDRATTLGAARGVTATEVALAWVLCQPFATIAVAGGRTPDELRSNTRALQVRLTSAELAWLDLESDAAPEGTTTR